jgi:PAS domain S-box-containing protein
MLVDDQPMSSSTLAPAEKLVPANILLVDDEARNLDVLDSLLDSPEYNLVRALTAERALMLLLDGEFAAIVLDIQMPGMSGIELATLIKQRRRTQHIPIIFLTAYFQEDKDVLQGYGSGAVDYLTKPINPQILRSKIAVFVDLYRKTAALAASNRALELEVTQRLQAEDALRVINNELEARVAARTAELLRVNDELSEREKALRASDTRLQHELVQCKVIETALRASEAQLRLVTDDAPVFITQLDRDHRFKFVNRTYARRFGFEPQELIGKHFIEVMGDVPYTAIRHQIEAALGGERVEFEAEIAYASLGPRWVFVIHEPERSPLGEIVGLVAVITDITERKLAEQEVAAARDKALEASRAKDEFLARLSHELRTPLNPVLLLASEAAANPALPDDIRADFETIAQNVTLEARLIDDLLDLTAITRGKVSLDLRPVQIHSVLQDALAMMRRDIGAKKLRVTLQLRAEQHVVLGDDMRLKQVFWNVIKNAVKFTPVGGELILRTEADPTSKRVKVHIADSGLGLTAGELDRIFAAFAQGDHATNGGGKFGGLGLGLVISRMLVHLHSGVIHANSDGRDQGSTFSVELPLCELPIVAKVPNGAESDSVNGIEARKSAKQRRVLLVEDHEPTCVTLTELLSRRGFRVEAATTLREARELAQRKQFDILISDIGLPDGNGCDLMAELRGRQPVMGVALTGYGMLEDMERSREAGFVTHLTKPVSIAALDKALALLVSAQV